MKYPAFIITYSFIIIFLQSCGKSSTKNFTVEGDIKGLTKGTVYLEKVIDTLIKPIDSVNVFNNGKFTLGDNLESPEIYYLRIKEIPDESLLIFGEKGVIKVNSKLEKFVTSAKVSGSKNHDLLQEYKDMIQKFNGKRLDIFKANFDAERANNQDKLDSLNKQYKSLVKKRYLYTANFAVNHADKEVAPYIALTELYNANISLLDTVNNSLTEDIKNSKYGKKLDNFITIIKKNEPKNDSQSAQDLLNK
jgi:acetolactate synthase small subunit